MPHINDLPNEILLHVLRQLYHDPLHTDTWSLIRTIKDVCQKWRELSFAMFCEHKSRALKVGIVWEGDVAEPTCESDYDVWKEFIRIDRWGPTWALSEERLCGIRAGRGGT